MLTTASQFGPRARSLRTNHATATVTVQRVLAASSTVAVHQCQQTRDFRFGSWFSHLDSEVQEELKRRQQAFKHKYADQLNRRLNWDKHPLADDARHAVKRMMASYWISHDSRPCGRPDEAEAEASKQRTPDNKDGVRPGQNIEDVERGAMEHLMFAKDKEGSIRGQKSKRKRGGKKNEHNFVPHTSYGIPEHDDYFIDPVTNRKVAKHPPSKLPEGGVDVPVKTLKDSKMHWTSGHGFSSDELSNQRVSNESLSAAGYENLLDFVRHKCAEPQDPRLEHNDLRKYTPVTEDSQVSSERPQYLDTELYNEKPVAAKANIQFEDLKPPYEDLNNYNSAVVDEMVARLEGDEESYSTRNRDDLVVEPEDPSKEDTVPKHNDLDDARPGVPIDTTAKRTEDSSIQEDLDRYRPDEFWSSKPLGHGKPYRPLIENLEPGDFPSSALERLREKYGTVELRKYTALSFVEPQGNLAPSAGERVAGEATNKFDSEEPAQYKPVYHNEPDGNPLTMTDERVAEDLTKRYDPEELAKYTPVYWNEPDGQPAAAEDRRVAEELTKEYDPAELSEYKPVYWNEPDGQPLSSMDERAAEELTKNCDPVELQDYERLVQRNEPDGQPPTTAEESSEKYSDLDQYRSIDFQQADGHLTEQAASVQDGLEEMDARRDYESADRLASEDLDKADEPSSEVLREVGKGQQIDEDHGEARRRQMLEQQMKRYQTASDATDYEASLAIKNMRARTANVESERQLTGNYVRDFPEDFHKSWTEAMSSAPPETTQTDDEFVLESQNMDGGLEGAFGRPTPAKVQPALDRHLDDHPHTKTSWMAGSEDSSPNATQDLNTVHATESSGTPMSPAYVKQHGDVSTLAERASEATTPGTNHRDTTNEPTWYKILAYDPTMQKIETAETSSFVPDTASALTPADALLRLSHPTKFFPHFASLQAEGYEIISGTGDVLVFRKVRPETSRDKPAERYPVRDQPAPTADESGAVETRINPIDMTGRPRFSPASANFASPTGYVNYDNIPETTSSKLPPPPPKIKYNIDVHREEPVFSGPKERSTEGQKGKKKSLGKRLVAGGVWVAGISYALGVIAEFFTTGGIDGMGPKGL